MIIDGHAILETKSGIFELRCLLPKHVSNDYLNWFKDNSVKQFISYKSDSLNLDTLRKYVSDKNLDESSALFGIFSTKDGRHVGNIKFEPINIENKKADVGILIGDEASRGLGLAGLAINAGVNLLQQHLGFSSIVVMLGVSLANVPAINAYMKIGFTIVESSKVEVEEGAVIMEKLYIYE